MYSACQYAPTVDRNDAHAELVKCPFSGSCIMPPARTNKDATSREQAILRSSCEPVPDFAVRTGRP